jgi:hypothetical protein
MLFKLQAGGAVVVDTMDIEPMVVNLVVKTLSKDTVDTTGGSIVGDDSITKGNRELRWVNHHQLWLIMIPHSPSRINQQAPGFEGTLMDTVIGNSYTYDACVTVVSSEVTDTSTAETFQATSMIPSPRGMGS